MGKKSTKKKMKMQFSAHLSDITEVNSSFDKGLMRICYHGNNRNGSRIQKSVFEKCINTLAYVPVVANYKLETETIGSHDSEYKEDKNGDLKEYVITMPLGLVPEKFNWFWEDVTESDGTLHEYLCCEVLLWKRQPVYQHVVENGVTDQSMEILVHEGSFESDGYYDVQDLTFTALCLLESAEPCFESASLHIYSEKEFKSDYELMYEEFKALFSKQSPEEVDIEKTQEGGTYELMIQELMEKYNVTTEDVTFETEGLSEEELEAAFKEAFDKEEKSIEPNGDEGNEDYALSSQTREGLYEAVSAEKVEGEYGSYSKYYMIDYDVESSEVYALDSSDYKLYGFKYSTSGDVITVDFDSKKKKKYAIVDFVDGAEDFSLEGFVEPFVSTAVAQAKAESEAEFNTKFDSITVEEINRLQDFEQKILAAEAKTAKEEIFNMEAYENIKESDEFKALVKDMDKFSVEEVETKCDALLAAHVKANIGSYSVKQEKDSKKSFKINIGHQNDETYSPYGDFMKGFDKQK